MAVDPVSIGLEAGLGLFIESLRSRLEQRRGWPLKLAKRASKSSGVTVLTKRLASWIVTADAWTAIVLRDPTRMANDVGLKDCIVGNIYPYRNDLTKEELATASHTLSRHLLKHVEQVMHRSDRLALLGIWAIPELIRVQPVDHLIDDKKPEPPAPAMQEHSGLAVQDQTAPPAPEPWEDSPVVADRNSSALRLDVDTWEDSESAGPTAHTVTLDAITDVMAGRINTLIYGPPASGKSHILAAVYRELLRVAPVTEHVRWASYRNAAEIDEALEVFQSFDEGQLATVVIDNLDTPHDFPPSARDTLSALLAVLHRKQHRVIAATGDRDMLRYLRGHFDVVLKISENQPNFVAAVEGTQPSLAHPATANRLFEQIVGRFKLDEISPSAFLDALTVIGIVTADPSVELVERINAGSARRGELLGCMLKLASETGSPQVAVLHLTELHRSQDRVRFIHLTDWFVRRSDFDPSEAPDARLTDLDGSVRYWSKVYSELEDVEIQADVLEALAPIFTASELEDFLTDVGGPLDSAVLSSGVRSLVETAASDDVPLPKLLLLAVRYHAYPRDLPLTSIIGVVRSGLRSEHLDQNARQDVERWALILASIPSRSATIDLLNLMRVDAEWHDDIIQFVGTCMATNDPVVAAAAGSVVYRASRSMAFQLLDDLIYRHDEGISRPMELLSSTWLLDRGVELQTAEESSIVERLVHALLTFGTGLEESVALTIAMRFGSSGDVAAVARHCLASRHAFNVISLAITSPELVSGTGDTSIAPRQALQLFLEELEPQARDHVDDFVLTTLSSAASPGDLIRALVTQPDAWETAWKPLAGTRAPRKSVQDLLGRLGYDVPEQERLLHRYSELPFATWTPERAAESDAFDAQDSRAELRTARGDARLIDDIVRDRPGMAIVLAGMLTSDRPRRQTLGMSLLATASPWLSREVAVLTSAMVIAEAPNTFEAIGRIELARAWSPSHAWKDVLRQTVAKVRRSRGLAMPERAEIDWAIFRRDYVEKVGFSHERLYTDLCYRQVLARPLSTVAVSRYAWMVHSQLPLLDVPEHVVFVSIGTQVLHVSPHSIRRLSISEAWHFRSAINFYESQAVSLWSGPRPATERDPLTPAVLYMDDDHIYEFDPELVVKAIGTSLDRVDFGLALSALTHQLALSDPKTVNAAARRVERLVSQSPPLRLGEPDEVWRAMLRRLTRAAAIRCWMQRDYSNYGRLAALLHIFEWEDTGSDSAPAAVQLGYALFAMTRDIVQTGTVGWPESTMRSLCELGSIEFAALDSMVGYSVAVHRAWRDPNRGSLGSRRHWADAERWSQLFNSSVPPQVLAGYRLAAQYVGRYKWIRVGVGDAVLAILDDAEGLALAGDGRVDTGHMLTGLFGRSFEPLLQVMAPHGLDYDAISAAVIASRGTAAQQLRLTSPDYRFESRRAMDRAWRWSVRLRHVSPESRPFGETALCLGCISDSSSVACRALRELGVERKDLTSACLESPASPG